METSAKYISLGPADYRKMVSIQFGSCPPRFIEVFSTEVAPQQVLVMEQEVKTLLEKGAIEYVPHSNRETGLYSWYFIVPKKDVGLCPILDLRVLNDSIMQFKFKMLTLRQIVPQIRSEDWFVTIDLKDAYLHTSTLPCHRKFLRFAFGGIYQFWGDIPISGSSVRPSIITPHLHEMHRYGPGASSSTGYSHNEPHQRLVDSRLVASVGSPASRCCSCSHERVGVTAKCLKECAFSTTEDHFSWHGMGLNVDAGVPVIDTFRVHPVGYEKYKARPVTHCQTVSETVRSYGSSIQCDTFWTVVHETPAVVAQDQKVFPEGQPFSHDQGYASMLTCLVMWKKPWFLSQGPMFGASCHRKMQTTDASLKGWGAILEGCSSQGLWKDHHPSWHINRLEMLAVFLALKNFLADLRGHHVLVHSDSTSVVSYINHQGGLRSRPLCKLESSTSRTGCDGADVAEASSVCISPNRSGPGSPGESSLGPGSTTSHCPAVAGQSMVPRYNIPSRRASSGAPRQEGPSVPSRGLDISPPTSTVETVGLASEGAQLIDSGLSTEVVETILHSRAPSTRKLYALKWKVFTSWCSDHQLDPVNRPVGTVLEFLQERFTAGLVPSTLKVYVVAISAYHIPLGGMSSGKDSLVSNFVHGTLRLLSSSFSECGPGNHNLLCPV